MKLDSEMCNFIKFLSFKKDHFGIDSYLHTRVLPVNLSAKNTNELHLYASYQRVQVKYLISCRDNFRAEYVRTRAIIRVSTRDNGEGEARAGICNLWYELRVFILVPS